MQVGGATRLPRGHGTSMSSFLFGFFLYQTSSSRPERRPRRIRVTDAAWPNSKLAGRRPMRILCRAGLGSFGERMTGRRMEGKGMEWSGPMTPPAG